MNQQIEVVDEITKEDEQTIFHGLWLEIVMDDSMTKPNGFVKTGDFKVDPSDRKAILMLNGKNPKQENLEEVIVHELIHLKMYPLDQLTEGLIDGHYEEGTPEYNTIYNQFMETLEVTVEEMAKCYLGAFGENKELSFQRCANMKSYDELFDGLKSL